MSDLEQKYKEALARAEKAEAALFQAQYRGDDFADRLNVALGEVAQLKEVLIKLRGICKNDAARNRAHLAKWLVGHIDAALYGNR